MLTWGPGLREGPQPPRGCLSRRSRALGAGMPWQLALGGLGRGPGATLPAQDMARRERGREAAGPCGPAVVSWWFWAAPRALCSVFPPGADAPPPPPALPPGGEGGRLVEYLSELSCFALISSQMNPRMV